MEEGFQTKCKNVVIKKELMGKHKKTEYQRHMDHLKRILLRSKLIKSNEVPLLNRTSVLYHTIKYVLQLERVNVISSNNIEKDVTNKKEEIATSHCPIWSSERREKRKPLSISKEVTQEESPELCPYWWSKEQEIKKPSSSVQGKEEICDEDDCVIIEGPQLNKCSDEKTIMEDVLPIPLANFKSFSNTNTIYQLYQQQPQAIYSGGFTPSIIYFDRIQNGWTVCPSNPCNKNNNTV